MPAPIEVHCPECQATLKLKNRDAVGRKVPCPKCKQPFVIALPAEDELEVIDDFDDFDEFDDFGESDDFGDFEEPATGVTTPVAAPKKSSGKKVWVIVGSIVGVVILGTGGFFGARAMGWLGGSQQVVQDTAPANDQMSGMPPGGGMPGMPGGGMPGMPGGGASAPGGAPGSGEPPDSEEASPPASATQAKSDDNPNAEFDTHWLPPNAEVVGAFKLGKMWDAAVTQQMLNDPTLGPDLKQAIVEMKKETILGPEDVSKITVGVAGLTDIAQVALRAQNQQLENDDAVEKVAAEKLIPTMVVRLRSVVTSAHLAAMGQKMKKTTLDGKTVFVVPQEPNKPRVLVYQVDDKTLVFSVERFIKQLIANGDPYTPRPDLAFVDGDQDFVVAVTLPTPITLPLPPGFATSPDAQTPVLQSLLGLNGKLKGLGLGMGMLENGSMSLKLQGLSSDETGSKSGKMALEEALKMGKQLLAPLKQNTFIAEQIKPFEAGLGKSKITQAGPEFGFQAAFPLSSTQGGLLAGLLAPAIQQARDAARRTQCANNLKQIGIGMFSHRSARQSFPDAAIQSTDGKPLLSWRVAILPYIGQKPLYDKFKLDEPWDSPTNKALVESIPLVYVCPGGGLQKGMTTYRLVSSGKSAYKDGKRVADSVLSSMGGPERVPLVVDAGDQHAVAWTAPDVFAASGEIGSHHLGGVNMLFADGHVDFSPGDGHDVAVPIDPNDDGTKDLAKFQGAWTVTAASVDGNAVASMVNQVFTFQDNQLLQQVKADQQPLRSNFQIDFSANPRTFDWLQTGNQKYLGLYQFQGNSLKLTVALPGQPRPQGLNVAGKAVLQLSLKRRAGVSVAKTDASPEKPMTSPGAKLTGQAKALFEALNNRRLVSSYQNKSFWIQLNPDGTTFAGMDGAESTGTYTIKNLELVVEGDKGGFQSLRFSSTTPKVGTLCTFMIKKTADGTATFGPVQLKILEILPATPKPKPANVLDGTWRVVSAVVSGKPSDSLKNRVLSFGEGKAALNVAKLDAIEYRFSYQVDTESDPTTFRVTNGDRVLLAGVYRFQGKTLQLCFVRGDKTQPPKGFDAKGIGHTLYTLERVAVP